VSADPKPETAVTRADVVLRRPYRVLVEVVVWAADESEAEARAKDVCRSRARGVREPAVRKVTPR
jgi:hypothetical protein